jgi:hypothetical protein
LWFSAETSEDIALEDKTPEPPHDDPAESKRFIDMAREVEADEGDEAMDKAFKKIIPPPHHQETLAKS